MLTGVATEETGQELLAEEEKRTIFEDAFLDELNRIFSELPQDEMAEAIYDELVTENGWLDMLYHAMVARENAA